jgi:putative peptidoglycan lipid II flippase
VTASILRWYCIAMVAQTFVFIVNQSFYARRVTRIALYNGIMTVILNTLFCLALTRWTQLGVSSLSLAYMLTSIISALALYLLYSQGFKGAAPRRLWPFMIRCFLCTSVLLLVVLILNRLPLSPDRKLWQLAWYGLRAAVGFIAYLIMAWILRMPESHQVTGRIGRLAARLRKGLQR